MDYKFLIEATANRERVREVKFVFLEIKDSHSSKVS